MPAIRHRCRSPAAAASRTGSAFRPIPMKRDSPKDSLDRLSPIETEKASNPNWRSAKSTAFRSLMPRFGEDGNDVPGPGQYKSKFKKGNATSFARASQRQFVLKTHNVQPFVPVEPSVRSEHSYDSFASDKLQRRRSSPVMTKGDRWAHREKEYKIMEEAVGPGYYKVELKRSPSNIQLYTQPRFPADRHKLKTAKTQNLVFPRCKSKRLEERRQNLRSAGKSTIRRVASDSVRCTRRSRTFTGSPVRTGLYYPSVTSPTIDPTRSVFASIRKRNPYVRMEHMYLRSPTAGQRKKRSSNATSTKSADNDKMNEWEEGSEDECLWEPVTIVSQSP